MAIRQPELGRRIPFSARSGVGGHPLLMGMNKQADPATVPTYQFQHLENVQIRGGKLVCRGGESKLNSGGATSGCLYGIHDTGEDLNLKLYGTAVDGAHMVAFDTAQSPTSQRIPLVAALGAVSSNLVVWDNAIWMGTDDNDVWKVALPRTRASVVSVSSPPEKVFSTDVDGGDGDIKNLHIHDNKLWFILNATDPANTTVYSWDGTTLTASDTPNANTNGTQCLQTYREELIALYDSAVRRRFGGAWTSLTLPIASFVPHDIIHYEDAVYMSVFDNGTSEGKVMKWDGTSLTVETTFTSAGSPSDTRSYGMFVGDDGVLYVNWVKRFDSTKSYLATFDGASWTNEAIQMTPERFSHYWLTYRGRLYYAEDGDGATRFTEHTTPAGLWSASAPGSSFTQEDEDNQYDGLCIG